MLHEQPAPDTSEVLDVSRESDPGSSHSNSLSDHGPSHIDDPLLTHEPLSHCRPQTCAAPVVINLGALLLLLQEATLSRSLTLPYLVMLVHLLDGIVITRSDLLATLRVRMRQRSIGQLTRREYVLQYLHEHPPPGDDHEPDDRTNEP